MHSHQPVRIVYRYKLKKLIAVLPVYASKSGFLHLVKSQARKHAHACSLAIAFPAISACHQNKRIFFSEEYDVADWHHRILQQDGHDRQILQ